MIRLFGALLACLALTACGGGSSANRTYSATKVTTASGPVSQACLRSERRAANPRLCGCIQAVANQSLGRSDQVLAASFFGDPHQAQVIRQSDNPNHESFWKRYKAFAATSESSCKGL